MSNQMFISNILFVPLIHLSAHADADRKKLIDIHQVVLIGGTDPFLIYS